MDATFLFIFFFSKRVIMENLLPLIIQLISGAVGGNVAGALFKNISLGTLWNSIAGIVGGGLGGQILQALLGVDAGAAGAAANLDIGAILSQIAGGGVGGGVLMAIVGLIRSALAKG